MANEHVPTREVVGEAPVDPLVGFFWARLDELEDDAKSSGPAIDYYDGGELRRQADATLADVAAKKAILDDYARYCALEDGPGRVLICQVTRDLIKRLAAVHDGHPDYDESWRP